ncbi:MAG: SpoVA/SpoVAEb family sporulation membrane protein [Coriobacteriia bacterium]|nr:SpoVA/SpoVAEb family sporulation membrane protein [Coriobacteriia bacterium]
MDSSVNHGKNLAMAFLFGGTFALIGQIILSLVAPISGPAFAGPITLLCFGVIALVMYIPGIHHKLAPLAGFGLILPFNGFASGIADAFQAGYLPKKDFSSGLRSALKLFFIVIGIGGLIDFLAGVFGFYVSLPQITPPEALTGVAALIGAFLVGGGLCVVFQLFLEFTKVPVPVLLVCGLALGGICTLFGLTDILASLGGGGFTILVVGAGQAVTLTTMLLMQGQPMMLLLVLSIFVTLFVVGIICALGNAALKPSDNTKTA